MISKKFRTLNFLNFGASLYNSGKIDTPYGLIELNKNHFVHHILQYAELDFSNKQLKPLPMSRGIIYPVVYNDQSFQCDWKIDQEKKKYDIISFAFIYEDNPRDEKWDVVSFLIEELLDLNTIDTIEKQVV